jgi:glc operon protein GlcG
MMSRTLVAAALALGAWPAQAESITVKKTLTLEGARKAIAAVEEAAKKAGATGVVAVVDDSGNLISLARIDGTFAAGSTVSVGKARTAVLFKKPTRFFEDVVNKGRTAMVTVDFTPLQGGVPIVIDGQVVGGIGVSGASSAAQDEEFALAGAAALGSAN